MIEGTTTPVAVTKSMFTTQFVEYDALIIAGGPGASVPASDAYTAVNLGEAYRHYKTIGAWGDGVDVLDACGIPAQGPGIVVRKEADRAYADALIEAIGWHRHWERT